MRFVAKIAWALVCAAAAIAPVSSARAWANARIESVRAHVDVRDDLQARVSLVVRVRVDGGWIEQLTLEGLDPGFRLDPVKPPWVVAVDGDAKFEADVRAAPGRGRLGFRFAGRRGPRRGRVLFGTHYYVALASLGNTPNPKRTFREELIRWSLPAWNDSLDDVTIDVSAPAALRLTPALIDSDPLVDTDVRTDTRHTYVRFSRTHLARTLPWAVAFQVQPPPSSQRRASIASQGATPISKRLAWSWTALVALVALLRLGVGLRYAQRRGFAEQSVLRIRHSWLRALCIGLGCASAYGAWFELGGWAAACLGAITTLFAVGTLRDPLPTARLGRWRALRDDDKARIELASRRHERFAHRYFDPTRKEGIIALGCLVATTLVMFGARPLPWFMGEAHWALVAALVPCWLFAPIRMFPLNAARRLRRAVALERRLRRTMNAHDTLAVQLVVYETTDGSIDDVRVRFTATNAPRGLERIEVAFAHQRSLLGLRVLDMLCIMTVVGTEADALMDGHLRGAATSQARAGVRLQTLRLSRDLGTLGNVLVTLDAAADARPGDHTEPGISAVS